MKMKFTKSNILLIIFSLISFLSTAQSWTALNGPTGGSINHLDMDTNGRLYALVGTGGDLFASSNGGSTWSNISNSLNFIHGFAVDGTALYAHTWGEVYKSTDLGVTWTKINLTPGMQFLDIGMTLITGVSNGLFISGTEGCWISVDGGVNWKKIYDKPAYSVATSSTGDIYISTPSVGVLKHPVQTTLANWEQAKFQVIKGKATTGDDPNANVGVNRNNLNKVFVSYRNATNNGMIYQTSTDGGTTWVNISNANPTISSSSWFTFTGKFYHIVGSKVLEVIDGASPTFPEKGKAGYSTYNIKALYYRSVGEIYVGVEGDGVWKSTDNAVSWAPSNGTPPAAILNSPMRDVEVIGNRIMAIPHSDSYGYWTSTNDGSTWTWQSTNFAMPTFNPRKVFKRLPDNTIIVSVTVNALAPGPGTYRTADGQTWSQVSTAIYDDYVTAGATEIYGFRGGATPVAKTTFNGSSWTWTNITVTGYPTDANNAQVAAYDGVNFYIALTRSGQTQYWKITMTGATTATAVQMNVASLSSNQYSTSGLFVFKGKLYIGDYNKIAISSDQGSTFKYLDYAHRRIFPIDQNVGGIGISLTGSLVVTKDDGITFSSSALPRSESHIENIAAPSAGAGDTYAATVGSPVLKFVKADSLIKNSSTPYIDFGWTKMEGPSGGGNGRKLMKSSTNQLFVEDWGGIYRFNGTTLSWESLDNVSLSIHGSFHDGTNLYHMRWGDLYKSTDNGNTFVQKSNNQFRESQNTGASLFKAANGNIFVLSSNQGVFRSTDDGTTFTQVRPSGNYSDIAESGGVLIAAGRNGSTSFVERSTDNGVTWTSAQAGIIFGSSKDDPSLASGGGAFVYTTTNNIYRSTDGGLNWSSIKSNLTEPTWNNPSKVFIAPNGDYYFSLHGYPGKLYVSTNQGTSWTLRNSTLSDIRNFIWIGTRLYMVGNLGEGVLFSDDGGATFATFQNNKGLSMFRRFDGGDIRINNSRITIANDAVLSKSNDQGATWTNAQTFTAGKLLDLPNGDIIAHISGISRSTNGGVTFNDVGSYNFFPLMTYNGTSFFSIGQIGACCESNLNTSSDLINWTKVNVSGIPTSITNFNSIASLGNKIFVAAYNPASNRDEAYEINSGVATRLNLDQNLRQVISRNDKVYLFSPNGFIFETSDGVTWAKRAVPTGTNKLIFANNGYLFLSGERGLLWVSRDGGLSWQNVSASNMNAQFGDIAIDLNTGIAYGTFASKPLFKSARIVVPNDNAGPTVGSLSPANGATSVSKTNLKLVITFNEGAKAVAGRNLRIFSSTNTTTPVETIAVTNGVAADNRITFTPTFTPSDLGVYYVTIDAGAFTDFYNNASAALSDVNAWRFTMADATAPAIAFTSSNFDKGTPKVFEATVTDNGGIAPQKVIFYYRNITAIEGNTFFSQVTMTAQAGGTATNARYTTTALNEVDNMGMEYYIEAEDIAGNKTRSPSAAGTYHYSYITYPITALPTLNGNVLFGSDASNYRIISIPFKLESSSTATIFDELGPANRNNWRLSTYAGSSGGVANWTEFDGASNLSTLTRGKGYWFIAKNTTTIAIEGASSPENNRTNFFKMTLQPGWNQIGNPYPIVLNWAEVVAGKTGIGQLKRFTGAGYVNVTTLNPMEGGFVFVSGASQELIVRFPGITSGGRVESKEASSDLSQPDWELPLIVEQGEMRNELSGIGMNTKANINFDEFDDLSMPAFEAIQRADLEFRKSAGEVTVLSKDVVPSQSEFVWDFALNTNRSEQTALRWDNTLFGSNTKELYLLDDRTQQLINMREQSSHTFNPAVSKKFKIYFGEDLKSKIRPGKVVLGDAYPNPAAAQVAIPFTLSDESSSYFVKLEIYNAQGSKIAVLHEGELMPGFYAKGWDTQEGNLTNGLYVVRMAVKGSTSSEVQTKKIVINR